MNVASKYAFELWSPNGTLLADLTGHAKNRTFTRTRNDAEDMSFELDFNDFHQYCAHINMHPRALLVPGQTELRIRRFNKYLVGGQITYATPDISSSRQIINVRAAGFLNLFMFRYIPYTAFNAVDVASMCWQVINTSQSQTNGDFGIRLGSLPTIALSNQTPNRVRIKDFIQLLASSPAYGFDFEFTYDKKLNFYTKMGVNRPEVRFEYPNNIKSFQVPLDATRIANEVIALGAGIGTGSTHTADVTNASSQLTYKLRQDLVTVNGSDNSDGVVDATANTDLAAWGVPIEIPQLVVDGNKLPFVGSYDVGDYVWVKLGGYKWFDSINGLRRIEKYTVAISDDDIEDVTVYLQI
jgi:hypothetical protein